MPRPAPVLSLVVLLWSLACAGEEPAGGGGGGGASFGRAPEEEPGGGRVRSPRGGKAGKQAPDEREGKAKRGGRRGGGDGDDPGEDGGGEGGGDDPGDDPGEDPDEEAPAPEPEGFACYAEGLYRVCEAEGKAATCRDETAKAGGPGATRAEAEKNAVEACDLHLDTLVSAADAGRGSAEVKRRCALTRCDD